MLFRDISINEGTQRLVEDAVMTVHAGGCGNGRGQQISGTDTNWSDSGHGGCGWGVSGAQHGARFGGGAH